MQNDKKFVDVLTEVVKELMNLENKLDIKDAEKKVVETLVKKGYELSEISEVLDNIFEMINANKTKDLKIRIIQPREIENFNDEAKEFIFNLRNNGELDEKEFEELLNHFANYLIVDINQIKLYLSKKGVPEKKILN